MKRAPRANIPSPVRKVNMKRLYLFLGIITIIAITATLTQRSLVMAASANIISTYVTEPLPTADMDSKLWLRAPATNVPLNGQQTTYPMNPDYAVKSVTVRSLNNGKYITFLIKWEDEAKNTGGGVNFFPDKLALQFPTKESGDPFNDFICMGVSIGGNETALVDIVLWRADFQKDIEQGFTDVEDVFPNLGVTQYPELVQPDAVTFRPAEAVGNPLASTTRAVPLERLYAEGFGTIASRQSVDATGRGRWQEGSWQVIITRPLASAEPANSQLKPGEVTTLVIAAWDGANQEVNGKKSVASWQSVLIEGVRTDVTLYSTIIPAFGGLTAVLIIALALRRLLLPL